MDEMVGHKEGCLYNPDKPGWVHRVPIDCTTRDDFEQTVERLQKEIETLQVGNEAKELTAMKLKARLYDFEHAPKEER